MALKSGTGEVTRTSHLFLCLLLLFTSVSSVGSDLPADELPAITVIIDDMGNQADWGEAALNIPGPVTYAFLPHTPFAQSHASRAHSQGKEVMLHLPMESGEGNRLGPGGLTLHQTEVEFKRTLKDDLAAIPHVRGVNNHMGSLLTRHPGAMGWLMEGLRETSSLFFIDSRTSVETLAQETAEEYTVPNARRDVFLDNSRDPDAIRGQFRQLIHQAKRRGYAIGIGHPYPETSEVLLELLSQLPEFGVRLIGASEMVQLQQRKKLWQQPSSPSLKVVKSSKP